MNNFISSLLGFEEIDYVVDGYFGDTENNSITIQISSKPSTYVCQECGSIHCNIHSRRPKRLIHSNFTSKKSDKIAFYICSKFIIWPKMWPKLWLNYWLKI